MSRTAYKLSAAIASLVLTAALAGCGSDKREGNANPANVARVDEATCRVCHSTSIDPVSATALVQEFLQSVHNADGENNPLNEPTGCQGCHGGGAQHHGVGPIPFPDPLGSDRCQVCHGNRVPAKAVARDFSNNCAPCHTDTTLGKQGLHAARAIDSLPNPDSCVDCHDIAAPQHGTDLLGDNPVDGNVGVRAVVAEFSKRAHHITGAAPTNAQCTVCHLEGISDGAGGVKINDAFHMKDAKVHLRDVDHAGAEFAWDGTNHTVLDNFCFACHDADGALDVTTLRTFNPAATAGNPFADTLTNSYDQVTRARVADVKTAFTATNASHHAVSGQRYKFRFSTAANAAVWAARTGNPMPAASEIAEGHTDLDGAPISGFDETMTGEFRLPTNQLAAGGFAAPAGEGEATLYEASKFVATYTPLGASLTVADNSLLHCGDCHTVGQWKPGSSTSANGSSTTVVIGAHGSANDYLLRNSLGTDEIHNGLTYVCFNCHVAGTSPGLNPAAAGFGALHPVQNKNQILGYATSHAVSGGHIQDFADSAEAIGVVNRLTISWEPDKIRVYDFIPAPGAVLPPPPPAAGSTEPFSGSDANSGNITGIACINCHNSGLRNVFGGIHGGNQAYVDGLNRPQTSYRFMPGMGNYKYAPPGGWDGKDVSDPSLLTQASSGVGAGKPMGGCYTSNTPTENAGFSACSHHGTSTAPTGGSLAALARLRVIMPAARDNYGGGTAATPTSAEPTVRESTAGNALVTRPLKY